MKVTAEPDRDPARRDGEWVTTARVTIRMTDEEYRAMDGLRFEVSPWMRFRLRIYKEPPGQEPGTWRYEIRDSQPRADEPPVVHSGARPRWDMALAAGQGALLKARQAGSGPAGA